ncbi:magnesium chelatase [Brumimicrobium salinarum]|uniref:Magnesium chelatase n=1 Tax=Brumimicrobium salinarum TaxID=2058658 RepID=A0A2I0R681_9FLAO|nr:MoxR family ATPase [Brumimicrobium salinarum]PKR82075.1 magnesium chelatase [Brumimicrobium salinarum]
MEENEKYMPKDDEHSKTENKNLSPDDKEKPTHEKSFEHENPELIWLSSKVAEIRSTMRKFIIGQESIVDLLMTGIFSAGHILLEGVPGVAKTLSAKVLSKSIATEFSRIQFTPDLMPSDVIGTSVFNMESSEFIFKKGPVFSNMILIDEINRAPAKTQAALFEVMEERQITYDGKLYKMDFPFIVIATQNPIEQEGTYALPEAQLDRFLFKITLEYPALNEEVEILKRYRNNITSPDLSQIEAAISNADLHKIQEIIKNVVIADELIDYIAAIVDQTRNHGKIYLGASPRASLSILKSTKATAGIRGRNFVTPDDIQFVAPYVLNHRIILTPEAEMEGTSTMDVIAEIIKEIEVPR